MEKLIETFFARDGAGNEYEIEVWQNFIETRSRAGTELLAGLKSIRTSCGLSVNHIDDETFNIVQTGQILRKV